MASRAILAAFIVLAAMSVVFFLFRAPEVYLSTPIRISIFLGLPATLAVSSIVVSVCRADLRWSFIASVLAAGIAIWSVEYVLHSSDAHIDFLSRQDRVESLANSSVGIAPAFPSICSSSIMSGAEGGVLTIAEQPVIPLSGFPDTPVVWPDGQGGTETHNSDQFGFNNPPEAWSDTGGIVAIGDSFTYGAGVGFRAGYVDWMRRLSGGSVVNLGCGGNGPLSAFASLREYGPILRPATTVWFFYEGNDLTKDLPREIGHPILVRYLDPAFSQGLADDPLTIRETMQRWYEAKRSERVDQSHSATETENGFDLQNFIVLTSLRRRLGLSIDWPVTTEDDFVDIVGEASRFADSWDGRIVFVIVPSEQRYSTLLGAADAAFYEDRLTRRIEGLGIPVLQLSTLLSQVEDPANLYDGHFNSTGYEFVGRAVVQWLRDL